MVTPARMGVLLMDSNNSSRFLAFVVAILCGAIILLFTIYFWYCYPDFHNPYFRALGVGCSSGLGVYVYIRVLKYLNNRNYINSGD
jgi:hypothetical protein